MNKITFAVIAILALCFCGSAQACDTTCPTGQHWVWQDEGNDKGSCQLDPTPSPTSTITNTNTNSNANTNDNKNTNTSVNTNLSNSSANSSSTGGSVKDSGNSSSTSVALGGAGGSSSVKDSGNSSSTVKDSGNSTIKDSGNSSIKDSGNSSVKDTNKQGQTQGQTQSTSSVSSASNNGNGNGNGANNASYADNSTTTYQAARIPVTTAYAPAVAPTASCFKGWGAGLQFPQVGGSIGGGKIDVNCAILEVARNYDVAGERYAACKVKVSNKYSKAAGVTMEDCMKENMLIPPMRVEEPKAPVALFVPGPDMPTSIVPQPQVKAIPTPTASANLVPVVPANPIKPQLVGVCTFAPDLQCDKPGASKPDPLRVTSVCDEMLTAAVKLLTDNPGTKLRLIGNANKGERESNTMFALGRAKNVERELVRFGASPDRITVVTGVDSTRTVELWLE